MSQCMVEQVTPRWTPAAQVALLEAYTLHVIDDPHDPLFNAGYDLLDAYFGAIGQLESRAVMARLVAGPRFHAGVWTACPMFLVQDHQGTIIAAGARFVSYEPATGLLCALDGTGWVAPSHRGGGIGSQLVPLQIGAGQGKLAAYGALDPVEVVDLADLEPFTPDNLISMRRATLWGRLGYRIIPRAAFPLALVGMADTSNTDVLAPPVEMLAIVRFPMATVQPTQISKALLHRLADHLAAAHAWAHPDGDDPTTAALHHAIEAAPGDAVELRPLPTKMPG